MFSISTSLFGAWCFIALPFTLHLSKAEAQKYQCDHSYWQHPAPLKRTKATGHAHGGRIITKSSFLDETLELAAGVKGYAAYWLGHGRSLPSIMEHRSLSTVQISL